MHDAIGHWIVRWLVSGLWKPAQWKNPQGVAGLYTMQLGVVAMARSFEYTEGTERECGKRFDAGKSRVSRPPTPVTPIPRRASASSPGSVRVRSRYTSSSIDLQDDDITRLPTVPPSAIWQDKADLYEIERHLAPIAVPEYSPFLPSSPSIDELDTLPPALEILHDEEPRARATHAKTGQQRKAAIQFPIEIPEPTPQKRAEIQFPIEIEPSQGASVSIERPLFPVILPDDHGRGQMYRALVERSAHLENVVEERADICEQVTNPPPVPFQPHAALVLRDEPSYIDAVVEADTVMDDSLIIVPSLLTDIDMYPTQLEDAVDVALTLRARELLHRKGSLDDKPAFIQNPLDYIRWWLLSPGRLEFLFWLGGAMLLGIVMCVVLMMTGVGLGWMSFGHLAH
jgi:hypothetical protein